VWLHAEGTQPLVQGVDHLTDPLDAQKRNQERKEGAKQGVCFQRVLHPLAFYAESMAERVYYPGKNAEKGEI